MFSDSLVWSLQSWDDQFRDKTEFSIRAWQERVEGIPFFIAHTASYPRNTYREKKVKILRDLASSVGCSTRWRRCPCDIRMSLRVSRKCVPQSTYPPSDGSGRIRPDRRNAVVLHPAIITSAHIFQGEWRKRLPSMQFLFIQAQRQSHIDIQTDWLTEWVTLPFLLGDE